MTNFHTMCQSQMPVDHLKHNFSQFQHKTVCCCCLFQGEQAKITFVNIYVEMAHHVM